jgi:hypothetical protein
MVGSPPHATSCCAGRVKPGVFTHLRRDARLRPDLEQAGVWNGWTPLTSGYGPRSGQRLTGLTSCFAPAPQVRFGQARTRSSPRPNGLRTMHGKTTGVCHIFNLGWVCCAASHGCCLSVHELPNGSESPGAPRCEKARRRRRGAGILFSLFHLASTNGCYCPLPFVPTCDALHV